VSRSAFYKAESRINERCLQEALVLNEVRQIKKDQPKLGTEKVYLKISPFLDEHEIKMGRDKLYDLLRAYHLLPKRGRSGVRTTYSKHHFYKYPNLVKDMEVLRANLVWCSDITYIRTGNGWSYLSLITDAYSHKLMGHRGATGHCSLVYVLRDRWRLSKWLYLLFPGASELTPLPD
jgi:transposase InsO family protein